MNPSSISGKRKVLIIDDDPIVAGVYRTKFEQAGFEVKIACDGQEGFYMVMESTPHVVLLDLMLPMMNGTDIIRKFRAQKRFEKLPIFVLTNSFLDNLAFEAAQAGANQVFNKTGTPPQEIIQAVVNALTYQGRPAAPSGYPQGWMPGMNQEGAGMPMFPGNQAPFYPPPAQGGSSYPSYAPPGGMPSAPPPSAPSYPYPPPSTPPPAPPSPFPSAPVAEPARPGQPPPPPPSWPAESKPAPTPEPKAPSFSNSDLKADFFKGAPMQLADMRKRMSKLSKTDNPDEATPVLQELGAMVHKFTGSAAVLELPHIAQIGSALEALIRELREKPKSFNPSTKRTTALALDALAEWIQLGPKQKFVDPSEGRILVLDDEIISRKAVVRAMEKTRLDCEALDSPEEALRRLAAEDWDLVILDVDMPGMDGFEVCSKLRRSSRNAQVPVVFVTGLNSFESRTRSMLSGGSDFIGKPFIFIELGLKALIHLARALRNARR